MYRLSGDFRDVFFVVTPKKAERLLIFRDWTEETTMYPHLCEAVVDGGLGFDLRQVGQSSDRIAMVHFPILPKSAEPNLIPAATCCNCINGFFFAGLERSRSLPGTGPGRSRWGVEHEEDRGLHVGGGRPWTWNSDHIRMLNFSRWFSSYLVACMMLYK